MLTASSDWIILDRRCVDGLGSSELFQSVYTPVNFLGKIALNSYESNCLRDWLAHRWNASSLEHTCIYLPDNLGLVITLPFVADNILDATAQFDSWLNLVRKEREDFHKSRK